MVGIGQHAIVLANQARLSQATASDNQRLAPGGCTTNQDNANTFAPRPPGTTDPFRFFDSLPAATTCPQLPLI